MGHNGAKVQKPTRSLETDSKGPDHMLRSRGTTFSSVQLLSRVRLFATPWTAAPGLPVHHQLSEFTQTQVY